MDRFVSGLIFTTAIIVMVVLLSTLLTGCSSTQDSRRTCAIADAYGHLHKAECWPVGENPYKR